MADKIARRGISIFIDGKEVANSVKGIKSEMQKLQNEQAKMTMGADNYVAHGKKIEYLKSLHREHLDNQKKIAMEYGNMSNAADKSAKTTENGLSKMANGFNKYFAIVTAGLAALTGLTLGLKKFMDMRNELEDASANLKSLTGLGDEDIEWLRLYAKELSTTTTEAGIRITASSKEIMDGFTTIGSKRPELLKNKEAMAAVTKEALTLAAAGKMDVATAFDVVTASMNQFNLKANESNRIINVIAAGSLEGSAEADNLAGSLKNVGTVADGSNMTLEDTVAMLEVLASKQLLGEEAGTKLRGALLKMKDAGVGYVSGAFNVRDAIIEINQQMKEKTSAAERDALLQKVFGAENITAGTILLNNVDAYDKLKVAITGTNIATTQAITQTGTVSARMAQAKNRFNELGMELVKNMNPAMLKATDFGTMFLKLLVKLPQFLKENKVGIIAVTAGLIAYLTAINLSNIATKAKIALAKIEEAIHFVKIVGLRLRITLTGQATAAELRLLAAQNALNASTKANLWGLIASAIAIATVYLVDWLSKTNAASASSKIFNEIIEDQKSLIEENSKKVLEEKTNLESLVRAIVNTNDNNVLRNKLIAELKEKYPGFIGFIDNEKISNNLLLSALKDVNDQYSIRIKNAALMAQTQAYDNAAIKAQQRRIEIEEELKTIYADNTGNNEKRIAELNKEDRSLQRNITSYQQHSANYRAEAAKNDVQVKNMNTAEYAQSQIKVWFDSAKDFESKFKIARDKGLTDQADYYQKQMQQANNYVKYYMLKRDELRKLEGEAIVPADGANDGGTGGGGGVDDKENDKLYKIAEQKLDDSAKRQQLILDEMFRKKLISEQLYIQLSEVQTIVSLENKIKLQEKYGKETIDTEVKLSEAKKKQLDTDLKNQEDFKKALDNFRNIKTTPIEENTLLNEENYTLALRLKILEAFHKNGLRSEDEYQKELAALLKGNQAEINQYLKDINLKNNEERFTTGLIGEKQYLDNNRQIYAEYIDNKFAKEQQLAEDISSIANAAAEFTATLQDYELLSIENKYAAKIKAAKKAGQDTTALEEQVEEEKKQVKKKYADVDFAITAAQIVASTASGVMNALKIPPPVGEILAGLVAATGLVQLGIANQQRQAIQNLWTGTTGFTPNVGKYTPTGVVHGGEFVGSMESVQNSDIRPVYDLINEAQKLGTASSLTKEDMARALRLSPGYSDGGFVGKVPKQNNSTKSETDTYLLAIIKRNTIAMERLNTQLDEGIEAPVYISGEKGISKQLERYNSLISNSKRG